MSSGKSSAAVSNVGIIPFFRLHYEVVCVGYACSLFNLFHCGVLYPERYIVEERVVEEYRLLVDIAYKLSEVVYAKVLDVDSIYEYLALLHVIVSWYEVNESGLA